MPKAYGTISVIEGEAVSSVVIGGPRRQKQGSSFFGGCCDMRRAVILVNGIMILSILINLIFLGMVSKVSVDDDVVDTKLQSLPTGRIRVIFLLQMMIYAIGIWGAVTFSLWQLYVVTTMYTLTFVLNLLALYIPAVIFAGLFAYPHIFLIREMKAGTMTEENYYNEEQSCCCV